MNTPNIKFLGIRFLRTALKNQHSLAGVALQNRQEIDLLSWSLNKEGLEPSWMRCVVSGQIPPAKLKKVSQSSRKTFSSYRISKNELESPWGWLQSLFGGSFSSVQSHQTLCNPMACSTPALTVHHKLLEITQTHIHCVRDAIQPSQPLSSPSPPTFILTTDTYT